MRLFYILGLLFCVGVSAKTLYKTIQADGSVLYSDTQVEGAIPVNLSAVNNVVMPALNTAASTNTSRPKTISPIKPKIQYKVAIIAPLNEETLRNNAGVVIIKVSVSPKNVGMFQLVMNDRVLRTQASPVFELADVNRGMHLIEVKFLDNSGKILASSQQQTFYLHKATALFNAN